MKNTSIFTTLLLLIISITYAPSRATAKENKKISEKLSYDKPEKGECMMKFALSGMTCSAGCASKIKSAMQGVNLVKRVSIDFEKSKAYAITKTENCNEIIKFSLQEVVQKEGYGCDFENQITYSGN
jgi:copper chaperone CopZ